MEKKISFASMMDSRSTMRRQRSNVQEERDKDAASVRARLVMHKKNSQGTINGHAHLIGGQIMKSRVSGKRIDGTNQKSLTVQTTKDRVAFDELEKRNED